MFTGRLIRRIFRRHNHTTRRPMGRFERTPLVLQNLEDRTVPATITVTGTGDNVASDGVCTLREAIQSLNNGVSANADVTANLTGTYGTADSVTFSSVFNTAKTINFSSEIMISKSMTITGKGEALLTLKNTGAASFNTRLFSMAAAGTATITLQKMTLTGGDLTIGNDGGAISIEDEDVRLTDVSLINNKTVGSGGAIAINYAGTQLTLTNCTMTGNSAGSNGGAIHQVQYASSTITVTSSTISSNTAVLTGGAFNASANTDNSVITINNSTLNSNTAGGKVSGSLAGAVFYVEAPCTINLTNDTFTSNDAGFRYGAVLEIGKGACSVTVDSCTFDSNKGGRGVLHAGYINFVSADNSAGTKFDVRASTFNNNTSASAAAIGTDKSGTVLIDRCSFTNNTIQGVGCVIRLSSETNTFSLTNSSFSGNTGAGNGGAIYFSSANSGSTHTISNTTFSGNTTDGNGGAINISGTASYTFNNCTFSGNTAAGHVGTSGGGAIYVSSLAKITINNSTFTGNSATSNAAGKGGAILRTSSSTIGTTNIVSSIIANNGAAYVDGIAGGPDMYFAGTPTITGGANLVGVADIGNFTLATTAGPNFTGTSTAPLDPLLGPLTDNGGATVPHPLTHQPTTLSLAINNGNQNGLFVDQAGKGRPAVGADIGAIQGVHPAPTAIATMPGTVTTAGATTYSVTVVYTDETGINLSSINSADVTISGPGYGSPASPNGAPSISGSGKSVTVTYNFDAAPSPGGSWDNGDNGIYTLTLANNQVADTDSPFPNYATGGSLGSFKVAIPQTYQVDALGDIDDGNYGVNQQTLREALKRANLDSGTQDTITFAAALNGSPIVLTNGELLATDSVSIVGNGADKTIIDGNFASRVFNLNISGIGNVTMSGMKIANGAATPNGTIDLGRGAGILSVDENVTLNAMWIDTNQTTTSNGAGIGFNAAGKLIVQNSTISGNFTGGGAGGGIYIPGGTSTYLLVRNSTVSGNAAGGSAQGGGIRIGNNAGGGTVKLWNSTITNNSSGGSGGGLAVSTAPGAVSVNIESSIVAGNTSGTGTGSDIVSQSATALNSFIGSGNDGHTLVATGTTIAGTNASPANPMLATLANNGGTMPTHLPNSGSPVRDIGSNPSPALTLDQRGQARVQQFGIDMGSVESPDEIPKATFNPIANITIGGTTPDTLTVTFKDFTGINYTSINASNITILDPSFTPLTIVSGTSNLLSNGQVRTATYKFAIPGGNWDPSDNGVYTVQMNGSQVFDIDGTPNSVVANPSFGSFRVAVGKSIVVDEATDNMDFLVGPNQLSIREAIDQANADPYSPDTITFGGVAFAGAQTVALFNGELAIAGSVVIQGTGVSSLTFDGQGVTRIFNLNDPVTAANVTISNMKLTNGWSLTNGGAVLVTSDHLTLSNCELSTNTATTTGGAIAVAGSYASGSVLTLDAVQLSNNYATTYGGAFSAGTAGALLQVSNSTLSGNSAGNNGGGFYAGYLAVGSVFQNTTISNNQANRGGAANIIKGSQTFINCTITNNSANLDGGGFLLNNNSLDIGLVMNNTIVANNVAGTEYDFSVATKTTVNGDRNLIGVSDDGNMTFPGPNNLLGTFATPLDPQLGVLQNNGGPTLTRALLSTSPAINAGDATTAFAYDQRGAGFPRLLGTRVDIGAYEAVAPPSVTSVVLSDGSGAPVAHRSQVRQVIVTFSEPVTFSGAVASAFTVHRSGSSLIDGNPIGDVVLTASPATSPASSVTITFSGALTQNGSLIDGLYDFTIDANQVSGVGGALDGDGIGGAGGNYSVTGSTANKWFRLFGDHDGDGTVNQTDFNAFRLAFLGGPSLEFDFGGDAQVSQPDFNAFRLRFLGAP